MKRRPRSRYVLTFEAVGEAEPEIHLVRRLLKIALRTLGLRCTAAREEKPEAPTNDPNDNKGDEPR